MRAFKLARMQLEHCIFIRLKAGAFAGPAPRYRLSGFDTLEAAEAVYPLILDEHIERETRYREDEAP